MWEHVGIVRDGEPLARACATLAAWHATLPRADDRPSHELANLVLCGRLTAEGALAREESRGAHYRRDFPEPRDEWRRHVVFAKESKP
jgi:L-aspartate oxidase